MDGLFVVVALIGLVVFLATLAYVRSSSPDHDGKTPGGHFTYDRGDRNRDDESPFSCGTKFAGVVGRVGDVDRLAGLEVDV